MSCFINIVKDRISGINKYNYDLAMVQLYLSYLYLGYLYPNIISKFVICK